MGSHCFGMCSDTDLVLRVFREGASDMFDDGDYDDKSGDKLQ